MKPKPSYDDLLKRNEELEKDLNRLIKLQVKEKRTSKQQIKKHRKLLDNIIENLPIGLQIFDKDGFSKHINYAQKVILGVPTLNSGIDEFNVLTDSFSVQNGAANFYKDVYENKALKTHEFEYNFSIPENMWQTTKNSKILKETVFPVFDEKGDVEAVVALLEDITQKKHTEKELLKSQQRLLDAEHIATLGHWELNFATGELIWSDEVYRIFEVDKNTFKTSLDNFTELIHPEDRDFVDKQYVDSVVNKTGYDIIHRILLSGERVKYVQERCITKYDEKGKALISLGTVQDVTEKIKSDLRLKESEERFRLLSNITFEGILIHVKGIARDFNTAFLNLLGYTYDELINKNIINLAVHEDDLPLVLQNMQQEQVLPYEIRVVKKDKSVIPVEIESKNIFYNNEKIRISAIRDITERKKALTALKESEENFRTFFDTITDFLFVLDEAGNIIKANKTVYDRLKFSPEDLIGKSVLMLHPEERRNEAIEIVQKMLTGEVKFCPIPIITKNNNYIPVETRVSKGIWNGKPVIFGVTKDISELQLSEEKFSKVFHINPAICGISDLDTRKYIDVNNRFCEKLGYEYNEVIGKTPIELGVHTIESRQKLIEQADTEGTIREVETIIYKKNGEKIFVLLSAVNIFVQDKALRYTVAYDITERKIAENSLSEHKTRLELAIEGAKEGTWDWNIQTGKIHVNEYWAQMLEYDISEIQLHVSFWEQIMHPDDKEYVNQKLALHLEGKTDYYQTEHRLLTKSGKWKWILDHGKVIEFDQSGKPLRAIGTHVDIDEIKIAQEKLKTLTIELQELNRTKDKFFSIIAHDLKNPFTAILGFVELLINNIDNKQKITNYSRIIQSAVQQTLVLLNNLLDWARMQTGNIKFIPVLVNINQFFNEIKTANELLAGHKSITLQFDLEDDLILKADKNMLLTIFRNLISNAIKFSFPENTIKITARKNCGYIMFTVQDFGVGISEENINQLFSDDSKIQVSGTQGEKGTGLGLVLCKDFINRHGGDIWVTSKLNEGTIFGFCIPVTD